MAFTPQFLDELKQRFTLSDVVGRSVKLIRRGREYTACCPFHNEKTPSFTVNDMKGFYHCFGCGAHGSVLDFVMETQGLGFVEAVEQLAAEAGMEVPRLSAEEVQKQDQRKSLSEVMELCASWYHEQLMKTQRGRDCYTYISGRGLSDITLHDFKLGYAPDSRTALKEAMMARGVTEDQLVDTGMCIKPDDGGPIYDRFRGRLMFPITDRQARMIAFGGRALSKEAKAKYLNSPDTVLFNKGQTLYNWAMARQKAYKSGQVVVVEGYTDVIALAQAGLEEAVAPLGTALTEEQIAHLWQMADEPLLCFDGDKAGRRAAERAMDRALPMLRAGKSLRFVFMPDGDDPDTLVQREGVKAFENLLDTALPLSTMLWSSLTDNVNASTPERRAGLEKNIFIKLGDIEDAQIKKLYQQDFRTRLYEKFGDARQSAYRQNNHTSFKGRNGYGKQTLGLQASEFGSGQRLLKTKLGHKDGVGASMDRFEKILLATVIFHPELLVRHEDAFAEVNFTVQGFSAVQTHLLNCVGTLDPDEVESKLKMAGVWDVVEQLQADAVLKKDWFVWPEAKLSDVMTGFDHVLARYTYHVAAVKNFKEAERDYAANMTEESKQRFEAARAILHESEEKTASIDNFGLESGRMSSF